MKESLRKKFLENEGGKIRPAGGFIKVALGYPNNYAVGMSNLGFQWIYFLINKKKESFAERFFYSNDYPVTLESGRKIVLSDIIAFSISFEPDYFRVVEMIRNTGLNPLTEKRKENDPIIIAGGGFATINPEPIAPFFDIIFIGDGEGVIEEFIETVSKYKGKKDWKKKVKEDIAGINGIYIPEYIKTGFTNENYKIEGNFPVKKNIYSGEEPAFTPILSNFTHFKDMELIEIERGCKFRCKFCSVGYVNNPFRMYKKDKILNNIFHKKVGLIGAAVADYTGLESLLDSLVGKVEHLGISSVRVDRLTSDTLKLLKKLYVNSITIAPEVASDRMRKKIGKFVSLNKILKVVEIMNNVGITHLKLYFIIGLPGEEDQDVQRIIEDVKIISKTFSGNISISVNPFVPKPFTPFQFEPYIGRKIFSRRARMLRVGLRNVKLTIKPYMGGLIQTILSRGGRDVATGLLKGNVMDYKYYSGRLQNSHLYPWNVIETKV